MITCTFNGRLGNNLFEIANVISVAKRSEDDFILPEKTWAGHRGYRFVDLSLFGYNFRRGEAHCENEYSEISFHYEEIPAKKNLKLSGFFQSWKYFEDIKQDLLNTYFIPNKQIVSRLEEIKVSEKSLGISVRRGDYLMLQDNHCVLNTDYYQNCIDKYFRDVDQVFVFSDDQDWCKLVFGEDAIYVNESVGVQLFLMSKMKNLILSNSTFAWWGAYLNQMNGTIVAPDPWFGSNYKDKDTKDLYVPGWKIEKHEVQFQPYNLSENMYN